MALIAPEYCQMMAKYNAWQNHWVYAAVNGLDEAQRVADRGLFWGSIQGTLSHLFWGDQMWISRFDGGPQPELGIKESMKAHTWPMLMTERPKLDARIAAWAWSVLPADIEGDFTWYSGAVQRQITQSKAQCIVQMFNHETHHRGQVHAALTALGVTTTDTDIPFMPEEVPEWL